MTTEQKRTKEKELWDKFAVRITYKDTEPYDKRYILLKKWKKLMLYSLE